jgi:hypothetical protein
MKPFKLTYINPGETEENEVDCYDTLKEAVACGETCWDDDTELLVWKLVKKGKAKSVTEWE